MSKAESKPLVCQYVGRGVFVKDRYVLIANAKGEPHHFLPGGRLEIGESLRDCVKREIAEELGKESVVGNFLGAIEHAFERPDKEYYEVGFFFLVTILGMSPEQKAVSAEDALVFRWVHVDELDSIDIRPLPVKKLLRAVANNTLDGAFWASTVEK